jgi:WD40 repeat protein
MKNATHTETSPTGALRWLRWALVCALALTFSGEALAKRRAPEPTSATVRPVTWTAPGDLLAVAVADDGAIIAYSLIDPSNTDKNIYIASVSTGKLLRTLTGHGEPVTGMRFLPGQRMLLAGGDKSSLRLWDTDTGAEVHKWSGKVANQFACADTGEVCVAYHANLTEAFMLDTKSGSLSQDAYVIDARAHTLRHTLTFEIKSMIDIHTITRLVGIDAHGERAAFVLAGLEGEPGDWDSDTEIEVWDLAAGKRLLNSEDEGSALPATTARELETARLSADGQSLYFTPSDGATVAYSLATKKTSPVGVTPANIGEGPWRLTREGNSVTISR